MSSLVVIWGLRLGLFLLLRILQWGEDRRFDEMRGNLVKLAVFWVFQAVWVWTVSLPVMIVNASDRNPSIQAVDIIGWIMWTIGFLIEATADQEKLSFKNSPENRGKWCNVGLWKYSRHPNYVGEVGSCCWDRFFYGGGFFWVRHQFLKVLSGLSYLGQPSSLFCSFLLVEYHYLRIHPIRNMAMWLATDNTRKLQALSSLCHQQYMGICHRGLKGFSYSSFLSTAEILHKRVIRNSMNISGPTNPRWSNHAFLSILFHIVCRQKTWHNT